MEFRRENPVDQPPAAGTLRAVLDKRGYVAVPLIEEPGFIVGCKRGPDTLRLLLDTGAEISVLDAGFVKKWGLTSKRAVSAVGTVGERPSVEIARSGLSIGEFDTSHTADTLAFVAFDFTAMNTALVEHRKSRPIDGLLGHTHLRTDGAIIDYSAGLLYLRTPARNEPKR